MLNSKEIYTKIDIYFNFNTISDSLIKHLFYNNIFIRIKHI